MENLTELLEKLAEKLGTTTEYLWDVLLRQAPISAASDFIYLLISIVSGVILFKIHRYLGKPMDGSGKSRYWHHEELVAAPMIIMVIIWGLIFFTCFFSIDNIINGFLNPEYWALKEVMSLL